MITNRRTYLLNWLFGIMLFFSVINFTTKIFALNQTEKSKITAYNFIYYLPDAPIITPFDIFKNMDTMAVQLQDMFQNKPIISKHIFKKRKDLEAFLINNRADFMIIDPYFWFTLKQRQEIEPLMVMEINHKTTHFNKLVTLSQEPGNNLKNFKNRSLCITIPTDKHFILQDVYFKGFINPLQYFSSLKYVDTNASALLAVLYNDVTGAIVPEYTKELRENISSSKIKTIYVTPSLLNGIFAVNTRTIHINMRKKIIEMSKNMIQTKAGRNLLNKLCINSWKRITKEQLKLVAMQFQRKWKDIFIWMEPLLKERNKNDFPISKTIPLPNPISLPIDYKMNVMDGNL